MEIYLKFDNYDEFHKFMSRTVTCDRDPVEAEKERIKSIGLDTRKQPQKKVRTRQKVEHDQVMALHREDLTPNQIAIKLGIGYSTVCKIIADSKKK